jgi:hypothetical protein
VPYDPERWHDFATSFAGAAGALVGLAFAAISFNLDAILRYKTLSGRAVETLVFFAYPLAASLLLQVPGLSSTALVVGGDSSDWLLLSTCRAGAGNGTTRSGGVSGTSCLPS